MSTFRPGREDRRQRLAARRGRHAQDGPPAEAASAVQRYPLLLRRAVAAALFLVLPALGWLVTEGIIAEERADARTVATQPHLDAKLVDIDRWSRAGPTYTVEYQGREYDLQNGYPLDETIGAPVRIVFDPEYPDSAIGVTEPWYWEPNPDADTFFHTIMVVIGFGSALVGAWMLLPDDRAQIAIFSGPGDPGWERRLAAIAAEADRDRR